VIKTAQNNENVNIFKTIVHKIYINPSELLNLSIILVQSLVKSEKNAQNDEILRQ